MFPSTIDPADRPRIIYSGNVEAPSLERIGSGGFSGRKRQCREDMMTSMAVVVAAKPEKRSSVSGIDRAFQVMDYLLKSGHPATAYDLAKGIGAPTSTVYDVIDVLVGTNALTRTPTGLARFGPRHYHYGLPLGRPLD